MRCVECGSEIKSVYREYGKGRFRLTKCETCGSFADKYVEYEFMLIFLDLVLHKTAAYRHLLFNRDQRTGRKYGPVTLALLQLFPVYVFLDGYIKWLRLAPDASASGLALGGRGSPDPDPSLRSRHGLLGLLSLGELTAFIMGVVLMCRILSIRVPQWPFSPVKAVLLASFGKFMVIPMMIWDYDISFAVAIHVFVLSCTRLALQTLFNDTSMTQAVTVVTTAFFFRLAFLYLETLFLPELLPLWPV